jgi:hypothetical protein
VLEPAAGAVGVADGVQGRRLQRDLERRRARGPLVGGARPLEHRRHLVHRQAEGHPAVTELDRASQRPVRTAADPDRQVGLDGVRLDHEALVVVVRAVVLGHRSPERRLERADGVVAARSAVVEIRTDEVELLLE